MPGSATGPSGTPAAPGRRAGTVSADSRRGAAHASCPGRCRARGRDPGRSDRGGASPACRTARRSSAGSGSEHHPAGPEADGRGVRGDVGDQHARSPTRRSPACCGARRTRRGGTAGLGDAGRARRSPEAVRRGWRRPIWREVEDGKRGGGHVRPTVRRHGTIPEGRVALGPQEGTALCPDALLESARKARRGRAGRPVTRSTVSVTTAKLPAWTRSKVKAVTATSVPRSAATSP